MSNKKLFAEWFWTDRWSASSAFALPMEARGLYREMLTQAWRRGAQLPNDHDAIRRMIAATPREWARSWPLVSRFWRVDGDRLVNDTQLTVYADAVAAYSAASERARKGGRARAQALAQAGAQAEPKHQPESKPLVSKSQITPPERSPGESTRAPARLAYGGKVLEVPKFLDEEFRKRLNGHGFDLTGFYLDLDGRLIDSGEAWDLRWIRDQFDKAAPTPVREFRRDVDRPFTAKERTEAERVRAKSWGGRCRHEPRCDTAVACVAAIILGWREAAEQPA